MDKHFVDTCTIVVGPATGTVFPISSLDFKINALYDTGATKSCMSLKTFESLKLRLTKDRWLHGTGVCRGSRDVPTFWQSEPGGCPHPQLAGLTT